MPACVKVNAPTGQAFTQAPQPMHFFLVYSFSVRDEMPSGVMAPYAGKRASFHEDRDTNARPVVYGVSFDIE